MWSNTSLNIAVKEFFFLDEIDIYIGGWVGPLQSVGGRKRKKSDLL